MLTPGKFSVNDRGSFTYTVPVAVPPGTAGMVPSLSLDYDSQMGNGLEGVGWSLQGLPSIGRCPRTLAQDGVHGGVNFDANDRFCMEGQRLILISGTYGADGSQYRTEIEGFSKIIAHGQAGNGPAWFEVHTKAGQEMDFGNTTDSRILAQGKTTARAWAVNKVIDTVGNYLTVTYTNDETNGQAYPNEIDYTGNAGQSLATYNKVTFVYATRGDITPMYQAGSLVQATVILTDIKTWAGSSEIADYKLGYSAGSSTTPSLLTSIQHCDGQPTQTCLPATGFGWQGSLWQPTMTENVLPASMNSAYQGQVIPGDFNADGITDVMINDPYPGPPPGGQNQPCDIFVGTGAAGAFVSSGMVANFYQWQYEPPWYGFRQATNCLNNWNIISPQLIPSQSGNGYTDMVLNQLVGSDNHSGNLVSFYLQNQSPTHKRLYSYGEYGDFGTGGYPGDFNGDGRTDFLAPSLTSGGLYAEYYAGGGDSGIIGNGPFAVGDFDGDGCADALSIGLPYSSFPQVYNLIIFSCQPAQATLSTGIPQGWGVVVGDFNGDGKSDILALNPAGGGALYLSTGTGLVAQSFSVPSDWLKYTILVGDFNGDGKQDLALIADGNSQLGHYPPSHGSQVWLSNGTGFVDVYSIAGTSDPQINAVVADWNNDGAADLWIQRASGDAQYVFSFVPPKIHTVTNGLGVTTTVTYDRINNPAIYAKGSSAAYPIQDLDGPFYVVSRVDSSNGAGGTYSSAYAYSGAQAELDGRGFLGFGSIAITDSQTGIVQTTTYNLAFPYTGFIASQTKTVGSTTLSSIVNSYGNTSPNPKTYFVYLTQTVASGADLDGTALPTVTTSYLNQGQPACDAYGNPTLITVSTPDGATKTTTNTYCNDTTLWHLGRLLTAQVQSVVGTSNITRQTSYAYGGGSNCNGGNGLLTSEIVEPNSSSLKLETDYVYDSFGNRKSATVSGPGITTRTTSQMFDSAGEFMTSATNALNQSESWNHSASFGLPTSHTDIDQLTSSWNYDTFGRPTLATATDGTQTKYQYLYCSGVDGGSASCPANSAFLVQATPLGTDGATQIGPITITYYDALSREIASSVQGFDGTVIRVDTPYDAQGHIAQTSRPYFCPGTPAACNGSPQWTVFTYDALGRVIKQVMPDSSQTTYAFHGLTTSVTNDKSQTTTTVKNDEGLIASVTDAASGATNYVYDAFGDLLTTTGPLGKTITNTFDTRGRKITSSDPDMGGWSYGYDVLDELTSQTDAKNQTTTLDYDLLGRLTKRTEPDLTSTWTYDTAAHGVGRLAQAGASNGYQRVFTYDTLGRPSSLTLTINGSNYGYATSYIALSGKVYEITYPSGLILKHDYNTWGYLYQIKDHTTAAKYWLANTRDAELHLLSQTIGNTFTVAQAFSAQTGRVETIQAGTSNAIANFSYGFDTLGNLTSRADANESLTETYTYDSLNRLKTVTKNNVQSWTGSYDAEGDITSKSDVGSYTYSGVGAGPHAVTSVVGTVNGVTNPTFAYDADGNMTSGAGRSYGWTSYNMAGSVVDGSKTLSFTYDSEHQRITQVAPEGTTLYLNDPTTGAMSEAFVAGSTTTWRDYIKADGALVVVRLTQGSSITLQYVVSDHLGSATVVTDSSGNVLQRLSYDAWGMRRNPDGTVPVNPITGIITRGFTGEEMMDDVGLINFNARLYDPQLGRFLAADPAMRNEYLDKLLDRYGYVGDNPLSLTDPTGLCFISCTVDEILGIVVAIALPELLPEFEFPSMVGESLTSIAAAHPFVFALDIGISGGLSGFISTGNLKGALLGSAEALAFYGVGGELRAARFTGKTEFVATRFVAHGFVGGLFTAAEGGNFGSGFLAGGVGSLAPAPTTGQELTLDVLAEGTAESAVLGGIGSVLGGGKFESGAITGAFGYLFNAAAHRWTLSPRDKAYLDKYYDLVVARAVFDKTDPAFVLGVGVESGFAADGTYLETGDVFGMTGGSPTTMEYFDSPQADVAAWFRQWGPQVYGDFSARAFVNGLEGEDPAGNRVRDWKVYNTANPDWRNFIAGGILQMQKDIPLYLLQRKPH
ncbi:MAG TPA: FG-GAP-like repeat-containing protein [Caulobacteraceae bacterium]|nr:FG-GAP-like repeat-containing protein [Caulobacteraceae bacterium]